MDIKTSTDQIVDLVGGEDNVRSLTHCMTRLRFTLKDESQADLNALKKVDGVLGAVYGGGQLQVVVGQNVVSAFKEISKNHRISTQGGEDAPTEKSKSTQPWGIRRVGSELLNFIAGSVSPMIVGLVAGGMLKVVLLLVSLPWPQLAETSTFQLLTILSNVPFFFMPILIAYGASRKLGANPIYAMIVAAVLLSPDFSALTAAGEAVDLFGIPVLLATYSNAMIPALFSTIAVYWLEKLFNKIIPGIFKSVFVGMFTIGIGGILAFTVLGPAGFWLGEVIVGGLLVMQATVGPIAVGLLAAILPFMVMLGVHTLLAPLMVQTLATAGFDGFFRPALILHAVSEGGAALGAALRMKNKTARAQTLSIAFGAVVAGVTEPAIYGVALRYRRPMYGVIAGGLVGGILAGLLGAKAFIMGRTTILALPIFQETILAIVISCLVSFVVAFTVAFALGIKESDAEAQAKEDPLSAATKAEGEGLEDGRSTPEILAIATGTTVPLSQVKDEVFSSGTMGDGIAFELEDNTVYAPTSGELTSVFPGGHAYGITRDDGVEIMVHIGIDTVSLKGQGFDVKVKQGDRVVAGEQLVTLDLDYLRSTGLELSTLLIVLNDNGKDIPFVTGERVTAAQTVVGEVRSLEDAK